MARLVWAYGFTLVGITTAVGILLASNHLSSSRFARTPNGDTSQRFRVPQ